jgi:hypothetical protein
MSKAKWLILFVLALAIAVPSYAVEVSLGGFPSYMRTRARFLDNSTFINAMTDSEARDLLGVENANDELTIVDTTLRLTPQLVLSDAVTIRAQVDVFNNILWGGLTSNVFGAEGGDGAVTGELTADDSWRGSILLGDKAVDTGQEQQNFFNVRMLHADIVLPNNLGFVRIGRQPFDWGMGIWANGGWDPHSDLGFLPERFLWLKSWPLGSATFTQVLVSDLVASGNSMVNGSGKAFDIAAGASILSGPVGSMTATFGVFYFPWFQQDNIAIATAAGEPGLVGLPPGGLDADRLGLYSAWLQLKGEKWKFDYEVDAQEGTLEAANGSVDIDVDWQFEMAGRLEYYPGHPVQVVAIEGGWSQGQDGNDTDVTGNLVPFHPAYNIDNLLFKHIIPTIYNLEGSVENAYYGRIWTNVKFADHWSFMPHVLAAWNHETETIIGDPTGTGGGGGFVDVDDFLGVEVEGTLTWNMYPGVDIDLIGSIIFAGDGLTDLLNEQAAFSGAENPDASDTPWAVQGRMLIYIDEFFKGE